MLLVPPMLVIPGASGLTLSYWSNQGSDVTFHNGTNYYASAQRQAMGANDLQVMAVILAAQATSNYVDATGFAPPSGFTLKSDARATNASDRLSAAVYYMTGSTTQAFVEIPVDGDGNSGLRARILTLVLKNADTASPFDVDPIYESDFGSNPDPASFTVNTDGAMVFSHFVADNDSTITAEPYPTGYTDLGHASSFAGSDRTYIASYKPDVLAGTENPGALGMSSSRNWQMMHFAIKPAA